MPVFRVMSTIVMDSGLPIDAVVNTFHVQASDDPAHWTELLGNWETFQVAIKGMYPSPVATSGHTIKVYNLSDTEPRAPDFEGDWSFGSLTTAAELPSEVAICLSFQGARTSGLVQARRRGRMFLGPVKQSLCVDGRPDMTFAGGVLSEFLAFTAAEAVDGVQFGVWSRVNEGFVIAEQAWIDNAFDTQRRRGLAPTTRATVDLV